MTMQLAVLKEKLDYNSRKEYIESLVIKQIIKDFATNGIDLTCQTARFIDDIQLVTELTYVIDSLLSNSLEKLKVLLYQIDIPVHSLFIDGEGRVKSPGEIAYLIIQRELLKVLTRIYFKELE